MIKKRPVSAREVAVFTLFSMNEEGAWSDGALHYYLNQAKLSIKDVALATRLAYGVLQNRSMCDFYLSKYSKIRLSKISPRVLDCLRLGIYQLTMLDRIPVHAAVSETVQLIRLYCRANERTIGFANGVLRTIARDAQSCTLPKLNCPNKESFYAVRYNHPEWLIHALFEKYDLKTVEQIAISNNEIPPISVRVNRLKATCEQVLARLAADGYTVSKHPSTDAVLQCEGGDISEHPLFINGSITIQDGASAVCVEVLDPQPHSKVIDCCAAPGGKSFYIAERMKNTGSLLACDIYEHKLLKISEGAHRLGLTNIQTHLADARILCHDFVQTADFVLCDVPCSGMGIIRKKPEIRFKNDLELRQLPVIQKAILENASYYVKPGGILVYSTCTILERENEDIVHRFLCEHNNFSLVPFTHLVCGPTKGTLTLLPHLHQTDGFFIAKLRRNI